MVNMMKIVDDIKDNNGGDSNVWQTKNKKKNT